MKYQQNHGGDAIRYHLDPGIRLKRFREVLAPHFTLERELGRGGMGVVYLARDEVLGRRVALKVLPPEGATAISVERFLREARILARLRHPSIVSVYQAGQEGDVLYFAMDYVEGDTLETRLQRGALPPDAVLSLARQLLAALAAAHRLGIVHRDIKPGNIFLTGEGALLGDFGIARTDSDSSLTQPGFVPGTLAFMAPEQRSGHPATPASDVYSVGLVLFQAATGRQWIVGATPDARSLQGVPPMLVEPLIRALAPNPTDRWGGAAAFLAAATRGGTRSYARWAAIGIGLASIATIGLLVRSRTCELTDRWLTNAMLPAERGGGCAVARAENAYAQGHWDLAETAYRDVLTGDSTCLICAYRLMDIYRWMEHPPDPALRQVVTEGIDRFSQPYRALIQAWSMKNPERIDQLEAATRSYRGFYLAWYALGDELFHRGPLYGRASDEAGPNFRRAMELQPDFSVPWTDMALVAVSLDDSVEASEAIQRLDGLPLVNGLAFAQRKLAHMAFAFRYGDGDAIVGLVMADTTLGAVPELAAGPRLLSAFGQPWGSVRFGLAFERRSSNPRFQVSGLIGQAFGYAALGQLDSLRAVKKRLGLRMADPAWTSVYDDLEMVLQSFEADTVRGAERLMGELRRRSIGGAESGMLLGVLGLAWRLADGGRVAEAVALTDTLVSDPDTLSMIPILRSVVYLSRAVWFERIGDLDRARQAYRWHRHFHVPDSSFPQDRPMASEVDWAVGTLAEWRLARMLDHANVIDREMCRAYAVVARNWDLGDALHKVRAVQAQARIESLNCRELG